MKEQSKKIISRENVSLLLKILTVLNAFAGIILSFIFAAEEGYSSWYIRGTYFTLQSNLWIGGIMLFMVLANLLHKGFNAERVYFIKFLFTVSITLTFIVFWTLLAPFAHMENYNPWSPASITTHMFAPAFAIIDFFVDKNQTKITKKGVYSSLLPPLFYFVFASILCLLKVDFGRGDPYPYFFMDYYSAAGLFGFVKEPFVLGTAYWILLILVIVLSVAWLLKALHKVITKKFNK